MLFRSYLLSLACSLLLTPCYSWCHQLALGLFPSQPSLNLRSALFLLSLDALQCFLMVSTNRSSLHSSSLYESRTRPQSSGNLSPPGAPPPRLDLQRAKGSRHLIARLFTTSILCKVQPVHMKRPGLMSGPRTSLKKSHDDGA